MKNCSPSRRVLVPLNMQAPQSLAPGARYLNLRGLTMGTSWQVQAYLAPALAEQCANDLQTGLQQQLDSVVQQMSPWEQESDLSRFNRAEAGAWQAIPEGFFKVLRHAQFVAEQTLGAFDPSIGRLANLWGFGHTGKVSQAPADEAVAHALQHTGWHKLEIDSERQRIRQPGHLHLDLCSTAKGYAVDALAHYLHHLKITSYLIEVGGELRGLGCKPDGQAWWVELEEPPMATTHISSSTIVALHGLSIATSGDYRRCFNVDGKDFSHTIDPRTGYPVQHGLASVTVLHPECMIADALATAMTVLGPEEGMNYARQLHVAARFLVREGEALNESCSPEFLHMMEET
ncbi:MAG: FAD:protein FMN transferase [Burkholderiales bacterium]|nr:FAD:protein FMN transferase [Burkholderiales bacterium]